MRARPSFWICAAVLFGMTVLFPEDVPWRGDDARIFQIALNANSHTEAPTVGLKGSTGLQYGPLVTWIYRGVFQITEDPAKIIAVKSVVSCLVTFFSLFFLTTRLQLSPMPLLFLLASPYAFLYHRMYWDNAFLVPFSAILFAATCRFFQNYRRRDFGLMVLMAVLMFHTHLMVCFLFLPLIVILLLWDRDWLWRERKFVGLTLAVALGVSMPYLLDLVRSAMSVASSERGPFHYRPEGALIHGLFGVQYFSFIGFPSYFLPGFYGVVSNVAVIGGLGLLAGTTLFGVLPFYWEAARSFRRLRAGGRTVYDKFTAWLVGTVGMVLVIYPLFGLHAHPHYHNADWVLFFFILWVGWDRLYRKKPSWFWASLGSSVTLLAVLIATVHRDGGTREAHYGPTLGNQMGVARTLPRDPTLPVKSEIHFFKVFPDSIPILSLIFGDRSSPVKSLRIVYEEPDSKMSTWIRAVDVEYAP